MFPKLALITLLSALTTAQLQVVTITSTAPPVILTVTATATTTQSPNGPSLPASISKLTPTFTPTGPTTIITAYLDITSLGAVYASLISAAPSGGTTYALECPLYPSCSSIPSNRNVTISPNSVYEAFEKGPGYTVSTNCTVTAGSAVCYYGAGGDTPADATGDLSPTGSYETLPLTSLIPYVITVVEGLEKFTAASTTAGSGAKSGGAAATQTGKTGGAGSLREGAGVWMILGGLVGLVGLANL